MFKKFRLSALALLALTSQTLAHARYQMPAPLPPPEPPAKILAVGKASWYSRRSPGIRRRTANNEIFDDTAMTCAMWGVAFNQKIKVTNLENGKSVVVRVNDRGPHKRYVRKGRVVDLSKAAFSQIAHPKKGLTRVQVELL